jgi:hypothetical protein
LLQLHVNDHYCAISDFRIIFRIAPHDRYESKVAAKDCCFTNELYEPVNSFLLHFLNIRKLVANGLSECAITRVPETGNIVIAIIVLRLYLVK